MKITRRRPLSIAGVLILLKKDRSARNTREGRGQAIQEAKRHFEEEKGWLKNNVLNPEEFCDHAQAPEIC